MPTRYDVSAVPPQGGYVAKQCPVRAQNDTLLPGEVVPASPEAERRMELGRDFEVTIFEQLLAAHPDAVLIEGGTVADREAATAAAMAAGTEVILGGRLPTDHEGRRVGLPDLLIRSADRSTVAYRAVDVKHHRTLDPEEGGGAKCSDLADPRCESSSVDREFVYRSHRGDLLQLAHYQRMLEAAGFAAADRMAGVIGTEGRVVWLDLDEPIFKTPSSTGKQKLRSTMEVYDFEFDFRLDIIAVTAQHMADPAVDLLLVPVKISECGECPWWGHCGPQLEAGPGDVSLLPKVGWRPWKTHRDHGVRTRADVARLDPRTARLVDEKVDVALLVANARDADPDTPVAELIGGKRPAQVARLEAAGVHTAADALELCATTAAYSAARVPSLADQIDQARAALGPEPAYRCRGVASIEVPRADVEVDIDLESFGQRVYLWGALVTDRSGLGVEGGYRAFSSWEPMDEAAEAQLFEEFWRWLAALRAEAASQGRTFRAYCYSEGAERPNMLRIARVTGHAGEVAAFLASDEWTDMLKVFRDQVITGAGNGLKDVAPLAGYEWPVEEAGGGASMLQYELALAVGDEADREAARQWLVNYNRGDVEATAAIRDWLDHEGPSIPPIDSAPVPN